MSVPSRWRRWGLLALLAILTLAWVPVVHTAQLGIAPDDIAAFARYKRFTTYDQHFTKYSNASSASGSTGATSRRRRWPSPTCARMPVPRSGRSA